MTGRQKLLVYRMNLQSAYAGGNVSRSSYEDQLRNINKKLKDLQKSACNRSTIEHSKHNSR